MRTIALLLFVFLVSGATTPNTAADEPTTEPAKRRSNGQESAKSHRARIATPDLKGPRSATRVSGIPSSAYGQGCGTTAWWLSASGVGNMFAGDSVVTIDFAREVHNPPEGGSWGTRPTFSDWADLDSLKSATLMVLIQFSSLNETLDIDGLGSVTVSHQKPWLRADLIEQFGKIPLLDFLEANQGKLTVKTRGGKGINDLHLELEFPDGFCSCISLTAPEKDELVLASRDYLIQWNNRGVDSLIVQFAADGVNGNFEAVDTVTAAPGDYEWSVPDTLTRKAAVRLVDLHNGACKDKSEEFRVKGYVLTRVDDKDDYEAFDPKKHGWSFRNFTGNLDPPSYANVSQFRYSGTPSPGFDPFTFQTYDEEFGDPPVRAAATDFPDWPSFVRAFGTDDAYWGPAILGIYRQAGLHFWDKKVSGGTSWNGSCAGMSVTSLLAFTSKESFGGRYPDIGVVEELNPVVPSGGTVPDYVREAINQTHTFQWGFLWENWHRTHKTKNRQETLNLLKSLLLDKNESHSGLGSLYISNTGTPSLAHAVTPIKLVRTSETPNRWDLSIYDPNRAGTIRTIKIDSTANTWRYAPSYAGTGLFYVTDPIMNYLGEAIRPPFKSKGPIDRPMTRKGQSAQSPLRVYPTAWASIDIADSTGVIGYADSATYNTMLEADFFLAATGYTSSPVYYELPEGSYRVELSQPPDSIMSLHLSGEGISISYSRFDATVDQTDHVFVDDGLGVANKDPDSKQIYFKSLVVLEEQERVTEIHKFNLNEGDSVYTIAEGDDALRLENFGSAGTYDLVLRRAGPDTLIRFHSVGVPIGEGAAHRIPPDWENLDTEPVEIQIDADGDGVFEGSMTVRNNVATEDLGALGDELPTRFELKQNYPNPFHASTRIGYSLPENTFVRLIVFDGLGRTVSTLVNGLKQAGNHSIVWDAEGRSSGVYFYRFEAADFAETKSMLVAK